MRLIAVVLGARSEKQRADDSNKLLSFGFRYYKTHTLYESDAEITDSRVWKGLKDSVSLGVKSSVIATIPRGSHKNLNAETEIDSVIEAPIVKGQELGKLTLKLEDEIIAEAPLVALEAVEASGFFARSWDSIRMMLGGGE